MSYEHFLENHLGPTLVKGGFRRLGKLWALDGEYSSVLVRATRRSMDSLVCIWLEWGLVANSSVEIFTGQKRKPTTVLKIDWSMEARRICIPGNRVLDPVFKMAPMDWWFRPGAEHRLVSIMEQCAAEVWFPFWNTLIDDAQIYDLFSDLAKWPRYTRWPRSMVASGPTFDTSIPKTWPANFLALHIYDADVDLLDRYMRVVDARARDPMAPPFVFYREKIAERRNGEKI